MNAKISGITGLIILAVILVGLNIISQAGLKGTQIDLTEGKIYTLSEGSKNIVKNLDEPVTLKYFYSRKLASANPLIADYGKRVGEFLEEFERASEGNIELEMIDPEPFSEAEENAVRAGLQGVPISQQERIFMGLQGINTIDGRETIPFFSPDREEFLEYDIAKLIYDLANPEKRNLTIITDLPMQGDRNPMAAMTGQQTAEPWVIYSQLNEMYDVEVLANADTSEVPDDTDVLMLVHPKNYTEDLTKAIDQYVLKGGKTLVFVDPLAESEEVPENPQNPMAAMQAPKNSDLPELFKAWGINLVDRKLLGDKEYAQTVQAGSRNAPKLVDYVLFLGLEEDAINKEEQFLSQLDRISMVYAGALEILDDKTTDVTPLLKSSPETQLIDVSTAQMFPDPEKILRDFESQDESELLGVLVSGKAKSAFSKDQWEGADEESEEDSTDASDADYILESDNINVAVFSDTDLLTDRTWVQIQRFMNMRIPQVMADNGNMIINLVDHMSGSSDLISLRSRGKSTRPFTRVEEMQKAAEQRSADKIAELQQELEETQQRLSELQRESPEGGSMVIASDELQEEIEKFRLQEVETRRELRREELSLRQDVEKLGQKLKFINIALIPILVGLFAVSLGAIKVNRRRRR